MPGWLSRNPVPASFPGLKVSQTVKYCPFVIRTLLLLSWKEKLKLYIENQKN